MNPGGNISAIVYKSFLDPNDVPKVKGIDIGQYFTKTFYERKLPVWQNLDDLGEPAGIAPATAEDKGGAATPALLPLSHLLIGLWLGLLAYVLFSNRKRARELVYHYWPGKG